MTPSTDGTYRGLLDSMERHGVDVSQVLPVVTAPRQFDSVNAFAAELNRDPALRAFGGIHPDCEEPEKKLAQIKAMGMKGIKLHPDYQECFIDDERYVRIVRECLRIGLFVSFHSGPDPVSPEVTHAGGERCVRMLDAVHAEDYPTRITLAHLGFVKDEQDEFAQVCGRNVMMDTGYLLPYADPKTVTWIIRKHGTDRILFATDSPWSNAGVSLEKFFALPLTDEERRAILWGNAERIGLL